MNSSRLGIYYLVLKGQAERDVFLGDTDCREFIETLAAVLGSTGYRLYTFCLLPTEVHLAVQMSQVPLADFAQRLVLKFNQRIRHKHGRMCNSLEPPSDPRCYDVDDKSRELLRFIHLLPLKLGQDPAGYPWSGHRTYLGKARMQGLETRLAMRLFGVNCREAREAYERFFAEGLKAIREKRSLAAADRSQLPMIGSLDQLVTRIAELARKPIHDIRSNSRERQLSLLRAVFTWHATRLEIATITEVARYLNRDPSTLYLSIKRYAALYPHLFEGPGVLDGVAATARTRVNGRLLTADHAALSAAL